MWFIKELCGGGLRDAAVVVQVTLAPQSGRYLLVSVELQGKGGMHYVDL